MAANPRVLKGFVEVREELNPIPSRFGSGPYIAGMLIAHSVGCRACFNLSRGWLAKVGFDDAMLDGYCAPRQLSRWRSENGAWSSSP